jgi:hypothetical protein
MMMFIQGLCKNLIEIATQRCAHGVEIWVARWFVHSGPYNNTCYVFLQQYNDVMTSFEVIQTFTNVICQKLVIFLF